MAARCYRRHEALGSQRIGRPRSGSSWRQAHIDADSNGIDATIGLPRAGQLFAQACGSLLSRRPLFKERL